MKKLFIGLSAFALIAVTSCDPKGKEPQNENPVEQQDLADDHTPEQYQGSTGVDEAMGGLNVPENIELKKQTFKGSLSSDFTSHYEFTVLDDAKEYKFTLTSENKDIVYSLVKADGGGTIIQPTQQTESVKLEPGEYVIEAGLKQGSSTQNQKDTYFEVEVE